jgi:hypothetical protein
MKNSVSRDTVASVQPPNRPASAPSGTPISNASKVAPSATSSDDWPPFSNRRNSSRPRVLSEPSTNSVVSFAAIASAVLVPFRTCVHGPTGFKASPFAKGN